MINQHQFQQSAKHFRSGRISLSEFQSRVFCGTEPTPHETKPQKTEPSRSDQMPEIARANQQLTPDLTIEGGDTIENLISILSRLKTTAQPTFVTGVSDAIGAALSQKIPDGHFDPKAQTFACDNDATGNAAQEKLAVVAIVNADRKTAFKTGYLAAIVSSEN